MSLIQNLKKDLLGVVLDFNFPLTGSSTKNRIWNLTVDMTNPKYWFITGVLSRISAAEVVINNAQL